MSKGGLYDILPRLACNPLQDMAQGMTQKGLLSIIFPNGEGMFAWFRRFNENSLRMFSVFGRFKGASLKLDQNIAPPIGLPIIPGITERRGR
ncbi:MAG: hypothetical protein K0T99_02740 [Alphaproteobacteria bacterium]|nr:hypothetical protein [Alphaproteobacteria bacterium]